MDDNLDDVTDAGLISLHKLKRLTSVSLGLCSNVTDYGMEVFTRLERLEKLNLSASMTDESVKKLAKYCRNLRYLNLHCNEITNESVYALYNTAHLRKYRLFLNVADTKVSLDNIEAFLPELEIRV